MCHHFLKQSGGEGTIITISSGSAGSLFPNMSSYISSKLAQMKLMEFIHIGKNRFVLTRSHGIICSRVVAKACLPCALG